MRNATLFSGAQVLNIHNKVWLWAERISIFLEVRFRVFWPGPRHTWHMAAGFPVNPQRDSTLERVAQTREREVGDGGACPLMSIYRNVYVAHRMSMTSFV